MNTHIDGWLNLESLEKKTRKYCSLLLLFHSGNFNKYLVLIRTGVRTVHQMTKRHIFEESSNFIILLGKNADLRNIYDDYGKLFRKKNL